ncbi:hypothetical protein K1719_040715 [Acacia pycnantha]|nr:hypothetical protein K1719_040715 [Acacia pycnantha]
MRGDSYHDNSRGEDNEGRDSSSPFVLTVVRYSVGRRILFNPRVSWCDLLSPSLLVSSFCIEDKRVKVLEEKVKEQEEKMKEQGEMLTEMRALIQSLLKENGTGTPGGDNDDQNAAV